MAFLVFEGVDASGKSTLLSSLCNKLKEKGLDFTKTKEPGGTKTGEKIREILLQKQNTELDPIAETLLYYTDRKQHIQEIIKPSLEKNMWILSDRYWASTSAYQCGGRGVDENFVNQLKEQICESYQPDLWILLNLPLEETLKRLFISKAEKRDRLEMENSDFHQRVKDYYLKLAKQSTEKWLILDGTLPKKQLLEQLLSELTQRGILKF